jgi:ubiquinone/menaquinone biosynthesis C-methylase UbiE
MAAYGYQVAGLDLSPAMVRLTGRRVRRSDPEVLVCRGRAGALPFAAASFDAAVAAFPTAYIAEPACLSSVARVLRPGGRLVVVEGAILGERGIAGRMLQWLYRVTGQRDPDEPGLAARFEAAGFHARRETVAVEGTAVRLIVAEAPAT